VVDGGRGQVRQQVGSVRGGDGNPDVLTEVRVVIVQLVALYSVIPCFGAEWFRPGKLDRVGRADFTLEVSRSSDDIWRQQNEITKLSSLNGQG